MLLFLNILLLLKKICDNGTDSTLIAKYAQLLNEYTEMLEAIEAWEDEDLTDAELQYYIDVQARVAKKLAEI